MASRLTDFGGWPFVRSVVRTYLADESKSVDLASSIEHHDEIMKLLESLVADKEALRKSNVELQDLLSESREALQALQEEAGERLASSQQVGTSGLRYLLHRAC
jgi:predicted nuclease with TOPRIM domain